MVGVRLYDMIMDLLRVGGCQCYWGQMTGGLCTMPRVGWPVGSKYHMYSFHIDSCFITVYPQYIHSISSVYIHSISTVCLHSISSQYIHSISSQYIFTLYPQYIFTVYPQYILTVYLHSISTVYLHSPWTQLHSQVVSDMESQLLEVVSTFSIAPIPGTTLVVGAFIGVQPTCITQSKRHSDEHTQNDRWKFNSCNIQI